MPANTQTRLLRVLADGEFYRVGGHTPIKVDVRIVTATHQNLELLVTKNRFREDLFHRLNVIRIQIPTLAERREDIPALTHHFLHKAAKELNVDVKVLTPETETYLCGLPWPGNVRQLENTVRWVTVMTPGREVHTTDLPPEIQQQHAPPATTPYNWQKSLANWTEQVLTKGQQHLLKQATPLFEKILIECALKHTHGHKQEAARLLGWGRNTLTRKLKNLSINPNKH